MIIFIMSGAMPLSMMAQDDDMYFVPKKSVERSHTVNVGGTASDGYYSGSWRSVDDYNRRGSSYEVLPADTGDIVSFSAVEGVYPDSIGDFALTQKMTRWDGYEPASDYWEGYSQGRRDSYYSYSWHSPWYYSSFYPWYDPWYDSWYYGYYDPWYYSSWHYGWYDPWYYGRYGWGWHGYYSWYSRPYYYGGGYAHSTYRYPGTERHGRISGSGSRGFSNGRYNSYSRGSFGSGRLANGGTFGSGTRTNVGTRTNSNYGTRSYGTTNSGTYSNQNGNFGGSRSNSGSYTPSRSSSSGNSGGSYTPSRSSGNSGGGSFGGSRSGGGGGGGRSGGGFGSGRR